MFEKHESQGNEWHEAFFYIEPLDQDFQIVFEASGNRSMSNIAIDDVALLNETACMQYGTTEPTVEEAGGIYDMQSCVNRCNETQSVRINGSFTIVQQDGLIEKCDCHRDCFVLSSCCYDYRDLCLDGELKSYFEFFFREN